MTGDLGEWEISPVTAILAGIMCIIFLGGVGVSALEIVNSVSKNINYPGVVIGTPNIPANFSLVNVNNSLYFQGYTPSSLISAFQINTGTGTNKQLCYFAGTGSAIASTAGITFEGTYILTQGNAAGLISVSGDSTKQAYILGGQYSSYNGVKSTTFNTDSNGNFFISSPTIINGTGNITGDLHVNGNVIIHSNLSVKRPYLNGYDNSTQNFINILNPQIVNISTIDDNYGVHIINRQNITFDQTGDYQLTFMPLLYVTSGNNKHIEFWIRKNSVDVPWSNTRIELAAQQIEYAQSITYQFDINNTATDLIQIYWWSDSTNSQILTVTGLTNPTRPNIPSVLLNIQKVSEITPGT